MFDLPFWWWFLVSLGVAGIVADLWLLDHFRVAVSLNLRLHGHRHMPLPASVAPGFPFKADIAPTDQLPDADGNPQGQSAPVKNIVWSIQGDGYSANGVGSHADVVAGPNASTGNTLTVSAEAVNGGAVLTQVFALPDVVPVVVPVAVALNLTVVPA